MFREICDYLLPQRRITVDSLLQKGERTEDFDTKLDEMRQEAWNGNISLTEQLGVKIEKNGFTTGDKIQQTITTGSFVTCAIICLSVLPNAIKGDDFARFFGGLTGVMGISYASIARNKVVESDNYDDLRTFWAVQSKINQRVIADTINAEPHVGKRIEISSDSPCRDCGFYTNNSFLPCTVRPYLVGQMNEKSEPICREFEPKN